MGCFGVSKTPLTSSAYRLVRCAEWSEEASYPQSRSAAQCGYLLEPCMSGWNNRPVPRIMDAAWDLACVTRR